ncbi:alpha-N-acetylglucosaminidase [Bacteroides thetaiotaomicron]|uniref:alpha-N-acetylglucosaminidase n=1 Tax=Bacteroides thetaiotaomicron TaxID=818 RepID=UPI00216686C0|nr:alpha-N-acetylglucosaminidase [Bacteroides thetaiotaomicron]MCS2631220.1 alpha-N-acetylglucosaminidase [Bacteroides thetaiotaomicron]
MAVGLNHYLKYYYCHTNAYLVYASDSIDMPEELPVEFLNQYHPFKWHNRFFLNYCTFGYTMPIVVGLIGKG